jgi:hypothetical protein
MCNSKLAALTLDLEPDCGGRLHSLDTLNKIDELIQAISSVNVPLTIFVSGVIFEKAPKVIEKLAKLSRIEFASHGYSHELGLEDRSEDIAKGIEAFKDFFGKLPAGYRAPQGIVSKRDLELLKSLRIDYDSSVFPTYRPGVFNNLSSKNEPYSHDNIHLLEIPITALRPLPIPFGLGYARLIGPSIYRAILSATKLPKTVVFGFHFHDITETAHREKLSGFWHWLYGRNLQEGKNLLFAIPEILSRRNYQLVTMSDISKGFQQIL